MPIVTLRFYAELNDFLAPAERARDIAREINGRASVKDVIESLGVPHTEVDLVLVNGRSMDFGYLVGDGDRVSVYPVFEALDVAAVTRVRPEPLREPRFLLDVHLGRLAAYLRLAGFDAAQPRDASDEALAAMSVAEHRILLTRDQGLLKRRAVMHGYCVRSDAPAEQLRETVERFDLARRVDPFSRCLRCNVRLAPASAEAVAQRVPPRIRGTRHAFTACPACGRVFWAGTHHERMRRLLERVLTGSSAPAGRPFLSLEP